MTVAPDYIEPVVGWRVWAVSSSDAGLRLRSLMVDATWPTGRPFVARCRDRRHRLRRVWRAEPSAHEPPEWSCDCGIYATREIADAVRYAKSYGDRHWTVLHRVVGRVSLWGSVLEYTDGWRAALAYPLELLVPRVGPVQSPGAEAVADALADYGVRVEVVDGTGAGRFGQALPALPAWPPV
jgi:hypothetical protein